MSGLKHQQLFGMSHELTMSVLDRILGGTGISNAKPRELTDIEGNIMRKMYKRMLDILSESWKPILPGCVTYLKGLEESYTALQITSPGEIVAVVTFEMTISTKESGLLSLCLPFPAVEKIMGHLSTQHLFSGQMAEDEEQPLHTDTILNNMNYAHMPISVLLGGCQLNMQQVMRLRAGDVLMLDRLSGSDMLVCINKKPKFFATPGGVHGHLAVCIKDPVNEAEAVTGFGLSDQNETFC
jgi:flagellar motor switch protein FliM